MSDAECRSLVGYLAMPTLYVSLIGIGCVLFTRPMNPEHLRVYAISGYLYSELWLLVMAWPLLALVCQTADGSSPCTPRGYRAWLGMIGGILVAQYVVEAHIDGGWRPWGLQVLAFAAVWSEFMWPGPYAPTEAALNTKEQV